MKFYLTDEQKTINFTPFYAEALAINKNIHEDIDRIYKENKEAYYMEAIKSPFYEFLMGQEKKLIYEEYYRKAIGLISYAYNFDDENLDKKIFNLLKKAYKKTYAFFKNKAYVDMLEYVDYVQESSYFEKLSSEELDGNASAALFFTVELFDEDKVKNFDRFINEGFLPRWAFCINKCNRFTSKDFKGTFLETIDRKIKEVPKDLQDVVTGIKLSHNNPYAFLYDLENLNSVSLFGDIELSKNEIREIISSYILKSTTPDIEGECFDGNFQDYMFAATQIKLLLKIYNEVKHTYFKNNKETMYVELDILKNKLKEFASEISNLRSQKSELQSAQDNEKQLLIKENKNLKLEIARLKKQLEEKESHSKEVIALRDFVYKQKIEDNFEIEDIDIDQIINTINKYNGIIIGGHPNWINKMQQKLDNWKFIGVDVNTIPDSILNGTDVVLFFTDYLSHKLYYGIIDSLRETDIKVGYIKNVNVDLSLKEIYNVVKEI